MDHCVVVKVSHKTAASLLITGELDVSDSSISKEASQIFDSLSSFPVEVLLELVDNHTTGTTIPVGECPQFGKLELLASVPKNILENGPCSYAQLGILLKGHSNDSYDANRKFGEYYGKTASFLGLISLDINDDNNGFTSSALTSAFFNKDFKTQMQLIQRLSFRVACIQTLLRKARFQRVNGYDVFKDGSLSTRRKKREGICHLLQHMKSLENLSLTNRIENIYWEEPLCN